MVSLTIEEIVKATKGELINGFGEIIISGISTDSRNTKNGELFIPIVGEQFDGHDFIENAVNTGAVATLVSKVGEGLLENKDLCIIKVNDTLEALHDLARYYILKFDIPIIGVTGSTGKTSTKDIIYSVLSKKYNVLKNQGNFNNHIGLPLTVFQLQPHHEIAIFEMGMSGFGEIDKLAHIVRPNIGVITNIGLSHIEYLGSQENILKAKMEITNYFEDQDLLIVNGDDKLLRGLGGMELPFKKQRIGFSKICDCQAINIVDLGIGGSTFDIIFQEKKYNFSLNIPGEHNIYNALCAIAIGITLNVDMELIQQGIKDFEGSNMRLNIFTTHEKIHVINDAYNASPDSMKAALLVLNKMDGNRKMAILGDMLEMGEYSNKYHYEVGAELTKLSINILFVVGEMAKDIAKGAIDHGFNEKNIFICENNKEVIKRLGHLLEKDDAILIKGSRGMKMEGIVEYVQERS